jgi:hypothetical protein
MDREFVRVILTITVQIVNIPEPLRVVLTERLNITELVHVMLGGQELVAILVQLDTQGHLVNIQMQVPVMDMVPHNPTERVYVIVDTLVQIVNVRQDILVQLVNILMQLHVMEKEPCNPMELVYV